MAAATAVALTAACGSSQPQEIRAGSPAATTSTTAAAPAAPIDLASAPAPFTVPSGMIAQKPAVFADPAGEKIITYSYAVPSATVKGGVDGSVTVAIVTGVPASKKSNDPRVQGVNLTGRSEFVATTLGGRSIGRLGAAEVLSGKDFGLPDRHTTIYVFNSTDLIVQITAANVGDESVVASVISSFNDQAAASIATAAKTGAAK